LSAFTNTFTREVKARWLKENKMDIYSEQAEFAFQFQASLEESPGQITNIGPVKMQTPTRAAEALSNQVVYRPQTISLCLIQLI
jgi:hypothetical protein